MATIVQTGPQNTLKVRSKLEQTSLGRHVIVTPDECLAVSTGRFRADFQLALRSA
jgi:hypothetical protein